MYCDGGQARRFPEKVDSADGALDEKQQVMLLNRQWVSAFGMARAKFDGGEI